MLNFPGRKAQTCRCAVACRKNLDRRFAARRYSHSCRARQRATRRHARKVNLARTFATSPTSLLNPRGDERMAVYDCYFRSLTGSVCAHRRIKKRDEARLIKIASRLSIKNDAAQCEIWCQGHRLYILPRPEAPSPLVDHSLNALARLALRSVGLLQRAPSLSASASGARCGSPAEADAPRGEDHREGSLPSPSREAVPSIDLAYSRRDHLKS